MAKKPRKWSNLDGQIPDMPVELTDREKKIRARVDALRSKPMRDLAADYKGLVEEEDFEDKARELRSVEYAALERVILDELRKVQELSGQDMWRGEGMSFSPKFTLIPIVTDRAAFLEWIRMTGRESFLDVPGPRIKSIVTDALNEEEAIALTPVERAALKPGEPGSCQPPPGIAVFMLKGITPTVQKKKP